MPTVGPGWPAFGVQAVRCETSLVTVQSSNELENFFFAKPVMFYNQYLYTPLIVVVNTCAFLWKTRFSVAESVVYRRDKSVYCSPVWSLVNLDNIFACAKSASSAQSIPVDIKLLIHRRGLDRRLRSGKLCSIESRLSGNSVFVRRSFMGSTAEVRRQLHLMNAGFVR